MDVFYARLTGDPIDGRYPWRGLMPTGGGALAETGAGSRTEADQYGRMTLIDGLRPVWTNGDPGVVLRADLVVMADRNPVDGVREFVAPEWVMNRELEREPAAKAETWRDRAIIDPLF